MNIIIKTISQNGKKIYKSKKTIQLLEVGKDISSYSIKFNEEPIEALQAILLGKNKIKVPEHLIYYDDKIIDFSDDSDITNEDIRTGKISWNITASFPLDNEIKEWIKKEKVDVNKLLPQLVKNFYETIKKIHKNVAL